MKIIKSRLPHIIVISILIILLTSLRLWLNKKPENEVLILWGHMEVVLTHTIFMALYSMIFTMLILLFVKKRILAIILLCIPLLVTSFTYILYKDMFPVYIQELNTESTVNEHFLAIIHFQRPTMWNDQLVFYEKVAPNTYVATEKYKFKIGHQVAQMLNDSVYQIEDNPLRLVFEDNTSYQIK